MNNWFQIFPSLSQVGNKLKNEPSDKQESEMQQESQSLYLTQSLFFFHSQRFLFKIVAGLQTSFAVSPISPDVPSTFSNFCFPSVVCSCLTLAAFFFCFISNWPGTRGQYAAVFVTYLGYRNNCDPAVGGKDLRSSEMGRLGHRTFSAWNLRHSQHLLTLFFLFIF